MRRIFDSWCFLVILRDSAQGSAVFRPLTLARSGAKRVQITDKTVGVRAIHFNDFEVFAARFHRFDGETGVAVLFEVNIAATLIAVGADLRSDAKRGNKCVGHFEPTVPWVSVECERMHVRCPGLSCRVSAARVSEPMKAADPRTL